VKKDEIKSMKRTPQRLAIVGYLKDNRTHPSASDVYKAVSENYPSMSFATVYNTMETLKNMGRIRELSIDPDKKRFDPNMEPHHHLICITCKQIIDIKNNFHLTLGEDDRCDYDIVGNHVEFYGVCPACKKENQAVI